MDWLRLRIARERKKDQADDNSKQKSLTIVEMEEHTEKHLQRIKKHILKWNILSEREKNTHTKKKLVFWARRNADDNDEEEENTTLMNKA